MFQTLPNIRFLFAHCISIDLFWCSKDMYDEYVCRSTRIPLYNSNFYIRNEARLTIMVYLEKVSIESYPIMTRIKHLCDSSAIVFGYISKTFARSPLF